MITLTIILTTSDGHLVCMSLYVFSDEVAGSYWIYIEYIWVVLMWITQHVPPQAAGSWSFIFAHRAFVWFFTGMLSHVNLQMFFSGSAKFTLCTFNRSLVWMSMYVLLHISLTWRRIFTQSAFERSFPCMKPHVPLQACLMWSHVITSTTFERSFTCMSPHVSLQACLIWSSVITLITFERFLTRMSLYVPYEFVCAGSGFLYVKLYIYTQYTFLIVSHQYESTYSALGH